MSTVNAVVNAIAEAKKLCKETKTAAKKAKRALRDAEQARDDAYEAHDEAEKAIEKAEKAVEKAEKKRDKALSKAKSGPAKAAARAPYTECVEAELKAKEAELKAKEDRDAKIAAHDAAKAALAQAKADRKAAEAAKERLLHQEQALPEPSALEVDPNESQNPEDVAAADRMVAEGQATQPDRSGEEEAEEAEEVQAEADLEGDAPVTAVKHDKKRKYARIEVETASGETKKIIDIRAEAAKELQRVKAAEPPRTRDVPQREAAKNVVSAITPEFKEVVAARLREAETAKYGKRHTVTPDGEGHDTIKQPPRLVAQREIAQAQADIHLCILQDGHFMEAIGVEQCIARDELFDHGMYPIDSAETKAVFWPYRKFAVEALAASAEDLLVEVFDGAQAIADELARGKLGKQLLDKLVRQLPDEYVVKRAQKVARTEADEQGMNRKDKSAHVRKATEECEVRRSDARSKYNEEDISSFVEVQPEHVRISASIILARMAQFRAQPSIQKGVVLRTPSEEEKKKPLQRVKHVGFPKPAKRASKKARREEVPQAVEEQEQEEAMDEEDEDF